MTSVQGIGHDPALPDAPALLGEAGVRAVGAFLAHRRWELIEARPVQIHYRPGRECQVRYRVRARAADGSGRILSVCAEDRVRRREPPPPPSKLAARYGLSQPVGRQGPYLVWAFPYDPSIPALAEAAWGDTVRELVRDAVGPAAVSVQPLRYRPRRRGVFRYRVVATRGPQPATRTLFGKALRPSRLRRAAEATGRLGGRVRRSARLTGRPPDLRLALPVREPRDGVLVTPELPGRSLRSLLLGGSSLPGPDRVAGLVDEVNALATWREPHPRPPAPGNEGVTRATGDLLARLIPENSADVARAVEAILTSALDDPVPVRFVHGDLYEDQVFVDENFALGLIDLDDMGVGDPAADAANFCAHLVALALAVPAAAHRLLAYRTLVRRAFLTRLDLAPKSLAWREALAMLRLATGPFRVLRPAWPAEVHQRVRVSIGLLKDR